MRILLVKCHVSFPWGFWLDKPGRTTNLVFVRLLWSFQILYPTAAHVFKWGQKHVHGATIALGCTSVAPNSLNPQDPSTLGIGLASFRSSFAKAPSSMEAGGNTTTTIDPALNPYRAVLQSYLRATHRYCIMFGYKCWHHDLETRWIFVERGFGW
jgi:hypothetical protein